MNIVMPQLGETVAEGTLTTWHKSVGDSVTPGDVLFEIETDKTSMDVPTTVAGVLAEIRVAAGATVPVGAVVAVLNVAQGANEPAPLEAAALKSKAPASPLDPYHAVRTPERHFGPATLVSGVKVTPVARRLAAQFNVDLGQIAGSGPHGRIVAKDIAAGNGARENTSGSATAAPGVAMPPMIAAPASATAAQIKAMYRDVAFREIPLDGMRRTIARRLLEAKQTIPHFYVSMDASVDRLLMLREEANGPWGGLLKLSINDFVIRALALALQRVPEANAVWAEDRILRFEHSDIGVAVSVEGGLFTPVIRQAEAKSVRVISEEMKSLAERARARALKPAEYQGGSITISNLGMYGVRSFSAIVNPPQSAILAVGAARRQPVESADGVVRVSSIMSMTLSSDHRVIDGVVGAQLLSALKNLIEAPFSLFA